MPDMFENQTIYWLNRILEKGPVDSDSFEEVMSPVELIRMSLMVNKKGIVKLKELYNLDNNQALGLPNFAKAKI